VTDGTMKAILLFTTLAMGVVGCRTVTTEQDRAARIIRVVNEALHTDVTLADDALTKSSVLIIERSPPRSIEGLPTQGRNMDVPIQFRLVINHGDCVLVDQRDRSRHKLENTRCEAELVP